MNLLSIPTRDDMAALFLGCTKLKGGLGGRPSRRKTIRGSLHPNGPGAEESACFSQPGLVPPGS